jgi:predicted permease
MENAVTLFRQILIMFVYMGCGCLLYKKNLITREGSASVANLLIFLILPCVIFHSFETDRTPEKIASLFWSFLLGTLILLLAVALAALIYRRNPVDNFGAAFSNAGFMGIPLITAMLGAQAVFYVAGMTAMLNILQWFYGQSLLSGKKSPFSLSRILKSPLVLSLLLGIVFFLGDLRLPSLLSSCVSALASMNAPVAMVVLGVYLAQADWGAMLRRRTAYAVSAVRLLLIPLCTLAFMLLFPWVDREIKMALLVAACAPVGSNVAVYAQRMGRDYVYAGEIVCLSTIFSLVTMPVVVFLAEKIL